MRMFLDKIKYKRKNLLFRLKYGTFRIKNLKNNFYILPLLFFICFTNWQQTHAQTIPKDEKFGFYFKGKRQYTSKLHFDLYSNLIVVKLKIDNSDTLNFILDTGVSSLIITDPSLAKKLNLEFSRKVKINGAGDQNSITANVSVGHNIDLGYIKAKKQNLVVLEDDILHLSEYMGIPIHGIFGHDLFSRFVVSIDFGSKEIQITEPNKFKYRKNLGDRFPIVVTQSKPFIEASELAQGNEEYKHLRLVIDTGAGHALMLNTQENSNIIMPQKVIRANLGRGLNGNIEGNIGRIKKFKIGKYELKNVLASFPDSLAFSVKFGEEKQGRQGSIGGEFLRRFIVTFNYNEGYIGLKPLKKRFRESFEHDMSGLEIRAKGKDFDQYYVNYVLPGSNADKAGMQEGDQIIFCNNKHFKEMDINEIYQSLSKKEGSKVELFIRRENELQFIVFRLKRVI
jgi:predicted aspartyl protease